MFTFHTVNSDVLNVSTDLCICLKLFPFSLFSEACPHTGSPFGVRVDTLSPRMAEAGTPFYGR